MNKSTGNVFQETMCDKILNISIAMIVLGSFAGSLGNLLPR